MTEQDNVRIVQKVYEAFSRNDHAAILDTLADRFEWHHRGAPLVPWGRSRYTKEEVRSFFGELQEAVEVLGLEIQKYVAQDDTVVTLGTFKGRSRKTGKEFDDPWAMVWMLKDGKIRSFRAYEDTQAISTACR